MERDLRSLTGNAERTLLCRIARRLPAWVTPDHLTLLGALALAGAGVCYRLVPVSKWAVLGVNACLFLNWFGDSLDGTVARVRNRQRPKYGFYVDHLVDAFGALALLAGLAVSTLVTPALAWTLLIAYLLLSIHMALKSSALGVHQIAFGRIGGTELRLLLGTLNVVAVWLPLPANAPRVLDVTCVAALLGIGTAILFDAVRTARELDERERPGRRGTGRASGIAAGIVAGCFVVTGSALADPSAHVDRPAAYGVAVGLPYLLALTIEKPVASRCAIQFGLGTMLFVSAAEVRVIIHPESGSTKPYAFLGPGAFFAMAHEPTFLPHVAGGIGLRQRIAPKAQVFVEGGVMGVYDRNASWRWPDPVIVPTGAVGFVFSGSDS